MNLFSVNTQQDYDNWMAVARRVNDGEFETATKSGRESVLFGLAPFTEPEFERAKQHLKKIRQNLTHAKKKTEKVGALDESVSRPKSNKSRRQNLSKGARFICRSEGGVPSSPSDVRGMPDADFF